MYTHFSDLFHSVCHNFCPSLLVEQEVHVKDGSTLIVEDEGMALWRSTIGVLPRFSRPMKTLHGITPLFHSADCDLYNQNLLLACANMLCKKKVHVANRK